MTVVDIEESFLAASPVASATTAAELAYEDDFTIDDGFRTSFHTHLLQWYHDNRRKMPWRGDAPENRAVTAYGVWVSEVMLQQTRVDTVVSYWNKWMERFPDVASLASASADEVNQMWAGLGYYRRAQNLRLGAQFVQETFGGVIPSSTKDLLTIPGIGPYTAGAISSIAFGQNVAAVDGNVLRVFARIFAIPYPLASKPLDKSCWMLAEQLVRQGDASSFNQALMELGATTCKPQNPSCERCPIRMHCKAASLPDGITTFPVKAEKKTVVKEKSLAVHVLRAACSAAHLPPMEVIDLTNEAIPPRYLVWRRPPKGLLANQWEFPSLIWDTPACTVKQEDESEGKGEGAEGQDVKVERGKRKSSQAAARDHTLVTTISAEIDSRCAQVRQLISRRCELRWSDAVSERGEVQSMAQWTIPTPIVHIFSHERHTMHISVEDIALSADLLERKEGEARWMTAEEMLAEGITSGCKKILQLVQTLPVHGTTSDQKGQQAKKRTTTASTGKQLSEDAFAVMKEASVLSSRARKKPAAGKTAHQ